MSDIAPDGEHFVVIRSASGDRETSSIAVAENWFEELVRGTWTVSVIVSLPPQLFTGSPVFSGILVLLQATVVEGEELPTKTT